MPISFSFAARRSAARLLTVSALIASSLGVAACFPLAATGIAIGALAVIDRRTIGAQTEDQAIELKSRDALSGAVSDASGISVTSYNRRVLLTGQVLSGADRQGAGAAIAGMPNVRGVYNELEIAGKASFQVSAADTTITTKVKTALLRDELVPGNSVKVKTERSVVYLMGLVTNREAQRAAEVASLVPGVARVVTVFELVSDDEASRLSSGPAAK
ncbi:MAG: BON domain-containing protein [Burkholderiaceae bacterium]